MKSLLNYFSKFEICLWCSSVFFILFSFFVFEGGDHISLIASLVGVSALIFCAKGNPLGQILIIIFGLIYGHISFSYSYYGEMVTYVGMSVPMAILSLISWVRNPYKKSRSEVKIRTLRKKDLAIILLLAIAVTTAFYFILKYFGTANLLISTISVATSFVAVCFTFLRSPFFALTYAINDLVLIALWFMATLSNISYLSVIICFSVFFINDMYSFYSWTKMKKRQQRGE